MLSPHNEKAREVYVSNIGQKLYNGFATCYSSKGDCARYPGEGAAHGTEQANQNAFIIPKKFLYDPANSAQFSAGV